MGVVVSSLVGEPPLTYLTRWRMWQASRLLAEGNLSVGETALRVGYESEVAFSKASNDISVNLH